MADIIIESDNQITLYVNEGIPLGEEITPDGIATLTNKTIDASFNTFIGLQQTLVDAENIKTLNGESLLGSGNIETLSNNLANTDIQNARTVTFAAQPAITATSGTVSINWATAQNQRQSSPTGGITYTFAPPLGAAHLQLLVSASSTVQAFVFPSNVKWLLFVWEQVSNKNAIINFWYDGSNYWAMGSNEV